MDDLIEVLSEEQNEKLERLIAESSKASLAYAIHRGQRFKLGEPAILTDPEIARRYATEVIRGRWPEAEDVISKSGKASYKYFKSMYVGCDVSPKIHASIERILLKQKDSNRILCYAQYLGGRLPEKLHNRMILEGDQEYIKLVEEREQDCLRYLKTLSAEQIKELLTKV